MRRILAIAIAILIGLPVVSPLFALAGAANPNLPACCRRDGKHHCRLVDADAMASSPNAAATSRPAVAIVTERCPYGASTTPTTPHENWSLETAIAIFAGIVDHPALAPQTESKRRISADRSRPTRGPPSIYLS